MLGVSLLGLCGDCNVFVNDWLFHIRLSLLKIFPLCDHVSCANDHNLFSFRTVFNPEISLVGSSRPKS